tara:strand:- start:546 stop:866 length:321 start_codon:yes stop_codon:yes gene_type:complete
MIIPLTDNKLDEMLASLNSALPRAAFAIDDGFENNVWLRIGEMNNRRLSRQQSLLATLIVVTAMDAGLGTAEQPASLSDHFGYIANYVLAPITPILRNGLVERGSS